MRGGHLQVANRASLDAPVEDSILAGVDGAVVGAAGAVKDRPPGKHVRRRRVPVPVPEVCWRGAAHVAVGDQLDVRVEGVDRLVEGDVVVCVEGLAAILQTVLLFFQVAVSSRLTAPSRRSLLLSCRRVPMSIFGTADTKHGKYIRLLGNNVAVRAIE